MRKLQLFFTLLLTYIFVFGNHLEIKSIRALNGGKQIVMELNSTRIKPEYTVNYDGKNQLIFINIKNASLQKAAENIKISNSYVESVKGMKMGLGSGIFIKHKKDMDYKINYNGNRFIVDFTQNRNTKKFTVVIDPGHGGKDPGASVGAVREKDIVLKITKELEANLKKDFNVIVTRGGDQFIPLSDRPKLANSRKADMFISLHVNAAQSSSAKGMEVFYFSKTSSPYAARVAAYENSFGEKGGENIGDISKILGELEYKKYQEVSAKFAKSVNDSLAATLKMENRGVQGANFAVLRGLGRPKTVIPGILVELGFITNSSDREKMANSKNQKAAAETIGKKVREYFYN